jgi:DNA-binding NtrC family response regulator
MNTVLIVDDEKNIRSSLGTAFRLEGFEVETSENGNQALEAVEGGRIDLMILDLHMPDLDGMEVLREIRRRGHDLPVMILTAQGSIEKAVEATRLGAFDFVEKPPLSEKILLMARNALRQAHLEEENRELRADAEQRYDMIGSAPPMRRLFQQIQRTAPTQGRVLIIGENGTGKELIARALHRHSPRAGGPFVRVNCAAIPRELFESELFGHEKGSFTGATGRRVGKFVRADHGTLFLDEVGEIPLALQPKILRAIETGEVEPIGAGREVKVDVRVLAATNRDLEKMVAEGNFREDLYYRLKVVVLEAPPLRDRKEDIPTLVEHFLRMTCSENNLRQRRMSAAALERLEAHDFPGNVRELRNTVERMVILTPDEEIDHADVAEALPAPRKLRSSSLSGGGPRPLKEQMVEAERAVIVEALKRNEWRMSATAAELGLERSHLYKKVKALGIERP